MDIESGEEWTVCVQTAKLYIVPPNDVDKVMAISKLKNGKVKGHDRKAAELIKERTRAQEGNFKDMEGRDYTT
jgi:hypothetical protein